MNNQALASAEKRAAAATAEAAKSVAKATAAVHANDNMQIPAPVLPIVSPITPQALDIAAVISDCENQAAGISPMAPAMHHYSLDLATH